MTEAQPLSYLTEGVSTSPCCEVIKEASDNGRFSMFQEVIVPLKQEEPSWNALS
jgi:hypothetical protein